MGIISLRIFILFIGVSESLSHDYTTSTSPQQDTIQQSTEISESTPTSAETSNSIDENLENNVKSGVINFFKEFNGLYDEDGVTVGYLISTINIDSINKISDSEVELTVSLSRIASNGDEFDSKWSGYFYLRNGKWVDDGNFVQTYSYNKATGERTI